MVLTNRLIYLVNVKTVRSIFFSYYVCFSESSNFKILVAYTENQNFSNILCGDWGASLVAEPVSLPIMKLGCCSKICRSRVTNSDVSGDSRDSSFKSTKVAWTIPSIILVYCGPIFCSFLPGVVQPEKNKNKREVKNLAYILSTCKFFVYDWSK